MPILSFFLAGAMIASPEGLQEQNLDRQFQAAIADYNAGHYTEAAALLEKLLPFVPRSFEAHELLGMVYAALSQDTEAIEQLQAAVNIKPDSAAARTNLAASLTHAGKTALAGEQFQKALALEPRSYTANHNLGEFDIKEGKLEQARPLLARAQLIKPAAYDNGYDLAMAEFLTARLEDARKVIQSLLAQKNTAELHNLLGQIDEKDGKYIAAANDFETAAHMDPSDDNLFAWGSELLLHRTYEPAIHVFQFATERYPNSPRLQLGLGIALYERELFEPAVKALLTAADLAPSDPRCYQFLARTYDSFPKQAGDVIERFQRYAELQPDNARAQYYYAIILWKGKPLQGSTADLDTVESLLKKSIALDGTLAEAHQQLGNLYADQHEYEKSIPEYERAISLNPTLSDAYYKLGTDYMRTGQKDQAQKEFAIYQKLRAEYMANDDKMQAEVQQFVYEAKSAPTKP